WTVLGPGTSSALLQAVAHDAAGNIASDVSDATFTIAGPAGVESALVTDFELAAGPKPMRRGGHFDFTLPEPGTIRLSVLDLQGREVRRVASGNFGAGRHRADFAGDGSRGPLDPGLYFVRLKTASRTLVRRF